MFGFGKPVTVSVHHGSLAEATSNERNAHLYGAAVCTAEEVALYNEWENIPVTGDPDAGIVANGWDPSALYNIKVKGE